ncbi:MAG: DUF4252 domain-containing protein [Duncaniella sp.]|nr:DUF4252 domain-containing protein [Duncaniella sp.]
MKRLYILSLLFTLAAISASAQVSALFDRYSDAKGVTSVYISKAMFRMMDGFSTGGMDLKGLGEKLNSIRVLNTENRAITNKLNAELGKEIAKDSYELLLQANDDGEKTTIYQRRDKAGVNYYLIVSKESNELSVILIEGSLTPADIKKMKGK